MGKLMLKTEKTKQNNNNNNNNNNKERRAMQQKHDNIGKCRDGRLPRNALSA